MAPLIQSIEVLALGLNSISSYGAEPTAGHNRPPSIKLTLNLNKMKSYGPILKSKPEMERAPQNTSIMTYLVIVGGPGSLQ